MGYRKQSQYIPRVLVKKSRCHVCDGCGVVYLKNGVELTCDVCKGTGVIRELLG